MTYAFPVPDSPEMRATWALGNIGWVVERGGDSYRGRVVQIVEGKPGGTILIKVVRAE